MFGLSMMEVMVIVGFALLILGPDQLPKAAKSIGKTLRDVRKASDDLRDTFEREVMQDKKAPPIRRPEGDTAAVGATPDAIIGANAPPPPGPLPAALTPASDAPPAPAPAVEANRTPAPSAPAEAPPAPTAGPVALPVASPPPPAPPSFSLGDDPFAPPTGGRRS